MSNKPKEKTKARKIARKIPVGLRIDEADLALIQKKTGIEEPATATRVFIRNTIRATRG